MSETVRRFRGSNYQYIDVATRGDETLAISATYEHHSGMGGVLLRFVAHSVSGQFQPFSLLGVRNTPTKFLDTPDGVTPIKEDGSVDESKLFTGIRLIKLGIPVFAPAVPREKLRDHPEFPSVCNLIAEWIQEQAKAEGFTPILPTLGAEIEKMLAPVPTDSKLVLEFPDLTEVKATLLKEKERIAKMLAAAEGDDDSGDEDEDEESIN